METVLMTATPELSARSHFALREEWTKHCNEGAGCWTSSVRCARALLGPFDSCARIQRILLDRVDPKWERRPGPDRTVAQLISNRGLGGRRLTARQEDPVARNRRAFLVSICVSQLFRGLCERGR